MTGICHSLQVHRLMAKFSANEASHEKRVIAVLDQMNATERVEIMLEANICVAEIEVNEKYFVSMIEAMLIAHYQEAHLVAQAMVDFLNPKRFGAAAQFSPAAILAMLKVARRYHMTKPANDEFQEGLPGFVGVMFRDYAHGATRAAAGSSPWMMGELSQALAGYLDPASDESLVWAREVLCGLQGLTEIGKGATRLFQDLNHRLFGVVSDFQQTQMLAAAFYAVKS